jgi:hypothetical protein
MKAIGSDMFNYLNSWMTTQQISFVYRYISPASLPLLLPFSLFLFSDITRQTSTGQSSTLWQMGLSLIYIQGYENDKSRTVRPREWKSTDHTDTIRR